MKRMAVLEAFTEEVKEKRQRGQRKETKAKKQREESKEQNAKRRREEATPALHGVGLSPEDSSAERPLHVIHVIRAHRSEATNQRTVASRHPNDLHTIIMAPRRRQSQ